MPNLNFAEAFCG